MKNFKNISILLIVATLLASCGNNTENITENSSENTNNCFIFDKEKQSIIHYNFYKEECGQNVVIPEAIDGVEVLSIGEKAFVNPHFVFFENIIGNIAKQNNCTDKSDCPELIEKEMQKFYKNYKTIENVKLPQNLIKIESRAFGGNALKNIQLPDTIEEIGSYVFDLTQIKEVSIPEITEYNKTYALSFNKDIKINTIPFEGKLNQNKEAQKYRDRKRIKDLEDIRSTLYDYKNYRDDDNKYPNSLDELSQANSEEIPKEKYLNGKTINGCTFGYKYTKISDDKYKLSTCLESKDEFIYESGKWFSSPFGY